MSKLDGWVIDLAGRVLGRRAGEQPDGAEYLSPAYELLGGQLGMSAQGQMGIGPMVALPPAGLPSADGVTIYGGALIDCAKLDADDQAMLEQMIHAAEQARSEMRTQRRAQASGLVMAGAGSRVNGAQIR